MNPRTSRRRLAAFAVIGVLAFVVIVAVEHLVDSSLDPSTHEISEYVHGPAGWLMTVGFAAWSLSLAATALTVFPVTSGRPVAVALMLAAAGLLLTACFATQTSAGRLTPGASLTPGGRLHDIGSGLATVALLGAVVLSLRLPTFRALRRGAVALLAVTLLADGTLLLVGPSVAGVRQRLLVSAACVWQVALALLLVRATPAE